MTDLKTCESCFCLKYDYQFVSVNPHRCHECAHHQKLSSYQSASTESLPRQVQPQSHVRSEGSGTFSKPKLVPQNNHTRRTGPSLQELGRIVGQLKTVTQLGDLSDSNLKDLSLTLRRVLVLAEEEVASRFGFTAPGHAVLSSQRIPQQQASPSTTVRQLTSQQSVVHDLKSHSSPSRTDVVQNDAPSGTNTTANGSILIITTSDLQFNDSELVTLCLTKSFVPEFVALSSVCFIHRCRYREIFYNRYYLYVILWVCPM